MPEVAAAMIDFLVPVVGQLNERRFELRGSLHVSWRGEKYESITAGFVVGSPHFDEPELIDVEIERLLKIRDADHGMQIFHDLPPLGPVPMAGTGGLRCNQTPNMLCHGI